MNDCLGMLRHGGAGERDYQGTQKNFWGDKYIHYLDSGDGLMGVYMSKFTKLSTLNICSLLYVNYVSIKL